MALEEIDVIDMITKRGADGRYGLIVSDEGVTEQPEMRLALLHRKLLTYRDAIAGGQLAETCPGAEPGDFFVQVVCEQPPTPEMQNITHLVTKAEPPIEIPVVFTAFPEGEWEKSNTTEHSPEGICVSEEMQEAVKAVFEAATQWLADDQMPRFVYWHEGEDRKLAAINEAKDQEEVIQRVTTWARKLGNPAHLCIQVSAVKTGQGELPVDTLLARCCERGEVEGFVLTQDVGQDPSTGNLEPRGKVRFLEVCPSFFPVD